jgi:hypothetical protein
LLFRFDLLLFMLYLRHLGVVVLTDFLLGRSPMIVSGTDIEGDTTLPS